MINFPDYRDNDQQLSFISKPTQHYIEWVKLL